MMDQAGTLELSASRLRHNVGVFRRRMAARVQLCAVVKANAYGHGLAEIVPLLAPAGVDWLCVYSFAEALAVARCAGLAPALPILALAPLVLTDEHDGLSAEQLAALASGRIRLTLTDLESARRLAAQLSAAGFPRPLPVHVQMDTGLTRQGVSLEQAPALLAGIESLRPLRLEGLFMHLSHGEKPEHPISQTQLDIFIRTTQIFKMRRPRLIRHAQNSAGAWNWPEADLDMVRLGIGVYGLQPSREHPIADLRPIACLAAPITAVHDRPEGVGVGYGHTFRTRRPSRLAVAPVGYADGYPRALSNRAVALVDGRLAPVVGRVSMDQVVLDATSLMVEPGRRVVLVSDDPASPLCLDNLAGLCHTIGYELATRWGARLLRKVI